MGRIIKLITVCIIFVFSFIVLGCSGKDDFEGKWHIINYDAKGITCFSGNDFIDLEIVKTNDNIYDLYLTEYTYNEKFELYNPPYSQIELRGRIITAANFIWGPKGESQHFTARSGGENRLIINDDNSIITYNKKDNTLIIGNGTLVKTKDGDVEKFKKSEKERLQKLFDDKKLGIYYQAKNISFVD